MVGRSESMCDAIQPVPGPPPLETARSLFPRDVVMAHDDILREVLRLHRECCAEVRAYVHQHGRPPVNGTREVGFVDSLELYGSEDGCVGGAGGGGSPGLGALRGAAAGADGAGELINGTRSPGASPTFVGGNVSRGHVGEDRHGGSTTGHHGGGNRVSNVKPVGGKSNLVLGEPAQAQLPGFLNYECDIEDKITPSSREDSRNSDLHHKRGRHEDKAKAVRPSSRTHPEPPRQEAAPLFVDAHSVVQDDGDVMMASGASGTTASGRSLITRKSLCQTTRHGSSKGGLPATRSSVQPDARRKSIIEDDGKSSLAFQLARWGKKQPAVKDISTWNIESVVESSRFGNVMGLLIIMNAATIGIQTDWMAQRVTDDIPELFQSFETFFLIAFTVELSLRLWIFRHRFFYTGDWKWNWFDFFVVMAQLVEEILMGILRASDSGNSDMSKFRMLRVLRIFRLLRILRVLRVLRLISELRVIVSSIVGSMESLMWTILLFILMLYIVGVFFTQTVTTSRVDAGEIPYSNDLKNLAAYFSSLGRTILSLYQAMSGGLDWDTLSGPLMREIHPTMALAFTAFIAFALLALMNVVTGVFLQTALESAIKEEEAFLRDQIAALFNKAETDQDGQACRINLDTIHDVINSPRTMKEWKAIDITADEAEYLFDLLDADGSGEIGFEAFLCGCLKLRGPSRSFHLLELSQAFQRFVISNGDVREVVMDVLHALEELSEQVAGKPDVLPYDGKSGMRQLSETYASSPRSGFARTESDDFV